MSSWGAGGGGCDVDMINVVLVSLRASTCRIVGSSKLQKILYVTVPAFFIICTVCHRNSQFLAEFLHASTLRCTVLFHHGKRVVVTMGTKEEMPNLVCKPPIFKKRARPRVSKARKKAENAKSSDEDTDTVRIVSSVKSRPRKESDKKWKREEFSVGKRMEDDSQLATSQRQDAGGEHTNSKRPKTPFGPMQAPKNLRTSVYVDYQPDICKDYKETGYCGFGDSCKFLHDRSDYKAGWQLDRDWAAREKLKREKILRGENPHEEPLANMKSNGLDDAGLPFACFLCREQFKVPVVTLCEHYFCEDCILKKMEEGSKCPICKKQLRGTLNAAPKLVAKLKERGLQQPCQ